MSQQFCDVRRELLEVKRRSELNVSERRKAVAAQEKELHDQTAAGQMAAESTLTDFTWSPVMSRPASPAAVVDSISVPDVDSPVERVHSRLKACGAEVKAERPLTPGVMGVVPDSPDVDRNKSPTPESFHSCCRSPARQEASAELTLIMQLCQQQMEQNKAVLTALTKTNSPIAELPAPGAVTKTNHVVAEAAASGVDVVKAEVAPDSKSSPPRTVAGAQSEPSKAKSSDVPSERSRSVMKPKEYDGQGPVNSFLSHFEVCARFNRWDDAEKLSWLQWALKCRATQVLWDMPAGTEMSYTDMVQASYGSGVG